MGAVEVHDATAAADRSRAMANRSALRAQVADRPPGVLAYLDGVPAGGGAGVVEGYPVDVAERPGRSAAELYHGPLSVFLRAGFTEVARPQPARPVVRLRLG